MAHAAVLLVEDDARLAEMLGRLLEAEGYAVTTVRDGRAALRRLATAPVDVVVLDRGLPDGDGLGVVATMRRSGRSTPVLVLTALGTVADRVSGLDAGAEDYLVKPFAVDELLARLRALLRRARDGARVLALGAGHLDLAAGDAVRPDGTRVALSPTERDLLALLARRPSRVFERDELRDQVFATADTRGAVDTYVYYLRRKLGPDVVRTVRGLGYRAGEIR